MTGYVLNNRVLIDFFGKNSIFYQERLEIFVSTYGD